MTLFAQIATVKGPLQEGSYMGRNDLNDDKWTKVGFGIEFSFTLLISLPILFPSWTYIVDKDRVTLQVGWLFFGLALSILDVLWDLTDDED